MLHFTTQKSYTCMRNDKTSTAYKQKICSCVNRFTVRCGILYMDKYQITISSFFVWLIWFLNWGIQQMFYSFIFHLDWWIHWILSVIFDQYITWYVLMTQLYDLFLIHKWCTWMFYYNIALTQNYNLSILLS